MFDSRSVAIQTTAFNPTQVLQLVGDAARNTSRSGSAHRVDSQNGSIEVGSNSRAYTKFNQALFLYRGSRILQKLEQAQSWLYSSAELGCARA